MKKECCNIEDIVKEFYNYLYNYILKKTGDNVAAEDIVQEVMYHLAKAYKRDIQVRNIKAWLFQTARHAISDYYKNRQETLLKGNISLEEIIVFSTDEKQLVLSDFILPMIKLLPNTYAKPLELSDINNVPLKEIAIQMDISLSAAKMRVKRGREKLFELFHECWDIELDKEGYLINCSVKETCTPLVEIEEKLKELMSK